MIIPWGTDAPIYHRPIATIGMIVVNVLVFLFFPPATYEDWTLVLGDGLHPLQWVTNIFMHAGFFQLAGNMIFLWTFGLVVEGKAGLVGLPAGLSRSRRRAKARACSSWCIVTTPVHMLGSSGIIFGLLAMCLVWAPMNEVVCIIWLRFTPSVFDVSILWFAAGYIALDVLSSSLTGAVMASVLDRSTGAILAVVLDHTTGAILGFVLGVALLKLDWVDCENWDLFAVWKGVKASRRRRPRGRSRGCRWSPPNSSKSGHEAETQGKQEAATGHVDRGCRGGRAAARCACTWSWARSRPPWLSTRSRAVRWRAGSRPSRTGST